MKPRFRSYDAGALSLPRRHQLLLGAVSPRPIAFVSTVSADGVRNLAPFSWFNVFSNRPPIVGFSPALRPQDGSAKDTLRNVEAVPEAVVNIANYPMVQQMALTSAPFAPDVDEFAKSGLTPLPSEVVRPARVAESPVQLECKVLDIVRFGDWGGAGNLILAEVVRIHVHESVFEDEEKGTLDPWKLDPIGRLGKIWYTRAREGLFQLPNPPSAQILGWEGLPEWIRRSDVLTGNDLAQLAQVTERPSLAEAKAWEGWEEVKVLLVEYEDDAALLRRKIQELARRYLHQGRVREAWMVLEGYALRKGPER